MATLQPSVFIGSSSEGLEVAREVELHLQADALTTIWKDGVFGLGSGTLESLINALEQFDFAIMILSPDDLLESRGTSYSSPRDNVLFELGLFMGRLGRSRTFIISEQEADLKLPSDLAGITRATYRRRDNLAAALSPTCTPIIRAIRSLGMFTGRQNVQQDQQRGLQALMNEIAFNLLEIDRFLSHGYTIDPTGNITAQGMPATLRYVTCMTSQFETAEAQQSLVTVSNDLRSDIFSIYQGFREINTRAEALIQVFRPWRASQYFEAIDEFQTKNRGNAEKLIGNLQLTNPA